MTLGIRVTWLGHATFTLRAADGTTLLIDPFVMSNPSCPDECKSFERLDVVAITHAHADHMSDVVQVCAENDPVAVVGQPEIAAWLRSQGVDEETVLEMNKGGTVQVAGVDVTMVDANHSSSIQDGERMLYGGEPAGLVFTFENGARVYHAGDTNVFGDMALIGELYRPDVALLPIGDHYTMGPLEAAKACELLGVPRVIPMHYGTWPILHGTPDALRQECERRGVDVDVIALEPGGSWG